MDILDEPTKESQAEGKLVWKVLAVAIDEEDEVEYVLHKFQLRKAVCVHGLTACTTLSVAEVRRAPRDR